VSDPVIVILVVVMGYLIGSLPMGVIVARVTGSTDPRTVGSGRTGGTNAMRAMGPAKAVTVGLLDLSKGAVAILLVGVAGVDIEVQAAVGVAAVLGSWKSVFLRFGGGRGVSTGVGGVLAFSPLIFVLAAPVFLIVIVATRYVSLGSLVGSAFGGVLAIVFVIAGTLDPAWLLYVIPGLGIIWIAHLDNIRRLLAGTERRFDPSDRGAAPASDSGTEADARPTDTTS
jgi:glycerol-3-phosphate acyltransferase PlsY